MTTILDSVLDIVGEMGLEANFAISSAGTVSIIVALPNEARAFLTWTILEEDYHFNFTRFITSNESKMVFISTSLTDSIAKLRLIADRGQAGQKP